MKYYSFNKAMCKKSDDGFLCDLYTFRSIENHRYIVEVESRDYDTLIVKFYLKNHSDSKNKYSLTIKRDSSNTGARNFILILNTLLEISKKYYKENNKVSFAYMGAPELEEIEEDKIDYVLTQRFRIYRTFSLYYFSPISFEHIAFENYSCYLIRNRKNTKLTAKKAEKLMLEYLGA